MHYVFGDLEFCCRTYIRTFVRQKAGHILVCFIGVDAPMSLFVEIPGRLD